MEKASAEAQSTIYNLQSAIVRPWLLPAIYQRYEAGMGDFLAELRPVVALFLRFEGIDYDDDAEAGAKLDTFIRRVQAILTRYNGTLLQITIGDKGAYLASVVGAPSLLADNAIHGTWVVGEPYAGWREIDFATHPTALVVNGTRTFRGSGAAVLGNPLNVVAWLANELPKFGRKLRRGDKITTGLTTDVYLAKPGDHLAADFGPMGRVEMTFGQ